MAYGALGPSHFAIEDLAIMRVLPNMTVVAPGDPEEVRALLPQIMDRGGPSNRSRRGRRDRFDGPPGFHIFDRPSSLTR